MNRTTFFPKVAALLALLLCLGARAALGADPAPPAIKTDETNSQEVIRAYLQLQEQLHATQLAVEQNRQESRENGRKEAEALAARLHGIEQALAAQRARELETMQSNNRVMVIVAGSFASVGFIAMLLMAYFQWRTVNGLAEISAAMPAVRALAGPPDQHLLGSGAAEQSNLRLLGAMEQLDKRLYELEHTTRSTVNAATGQPTTVQNGNHRAGNLEAAPVSNETTGSPALVLLAKAESMLNLDQPDAALASLEELLSVTPENCEALVKKGVALERLQKFDEALETYDRAIKANPSFTIAYLHKGGLCNRLERFQESLLCYEKALRTQEKRETPAATAA